MLKTFLVSTMLLLLTACGGEDLPPAGNGPKESTRETAAKSSALPSGTLETCQFVPADVVQTALGASVTPRRTRTVLAVTVSPVPVAGCRFDADSSGPRHGVNVRITDRKAEEMYELLTKSQGPALKKLDEPLVLPGQTPIEALWQEMGRTLWALTDAKLISIEILGDGYPEDLQVARTIALGIIAKLAAPESP